MLREVCCNNSRARPKKKPELLLASFLVLIPPYPECGVLLRLDE